MTKLRYSYRVGPVLGVVAAACPVPAGALDGAVTVAEAEAVAGTLAEADAAEEPVGGVKAEPEGCCVVGVEDGVGAFLG